MPKYKISSKLQNLQLTLEKTDGKLWGRVTVDGNIVFDSASSVTALKKKLKKALKDFQGLEDVQFDYAYDLTTFFAEFSFLDQSKIAELAGINPGLIRQYSSGHKQPSKKRLEKLKKLFECWPTG
jgi:hypothetical protein